MARQGQYINAQHNNFIQHATKTRKNNANYDEFTNNRRKLYATCNRNKKIICEIQKLNRKDTKFIKIHKTQIL